MASNGSIMSTRTNARLFNAWRFSIFFMENHVIFKGKFSPTLHLFEKKFKPSYPRNYVPTNVPIFMNPQNLSPMKINDFTVCLKYVQNTCMSLIQQISMEYNDEESYCGHI